MLDSNFSRRMMLGLLVCALTRPQPASGQTAASLIDAAPQLPGARILSPESPENRLRDRIRTTLAYYYTRPVNNRDHNCWEVMHWIIAYGVEAELLRGGPGGRPAREALSRPAAGPVAVPVAGPAATGPATRAARPRRRLEKLSKDAYRRQKVAADTELTRLGLRKNHLELAMTDPSVQANFVELRRITSELADVEAAIAAAEDAWLEVEERAP
ncbi:MAG: hypothetical protein WD403_10845 [Pirellulales bacterium]